MHPVCGSQGDVNRDALGDADFDGHPKRKVARGQFLFADIRHRHARRGVDHQAHPDRDREVIAQRQWQCAVLGGQRVGVAGVDDRHRTEQVLDGRADNGQSLAGDVVAAVRRLDLAQRPQHVFAQRSGVPQPGQTGAGVCGQGRGESPQSAHLGADRRHHVLIEAARDLARQIRGRRWRGCGVADHRLQRAWTGQARPYRTGQGCQHRAGIVGLGAPLQRRQQDLPARFNPGLQGPPQHGRHGVLAASHRRVLLDRHAERGVEVGRQARVRADAGQRGPHGGVEGCLDDYGGKPARRQVGGEGRPARRVRRGGRSDRDRGTLGIEQIECGRAQWAVTEDGDPADGRDTEDPVDDVGGGDRCGRTESRVADSVQSAEISLGIGRGRHAHPVRQIAQPVQPAHRGGLSAAGLGGGAGPAGGVRHDIADRHSVHRDQKVGVDGQTERAGEAVVRVDRSRTDRELSRRQQCLQAPTRGKGDGEVVIHQPDRGGATGNPRCQPRLIGQWPQHGDCHRFGGIRSYRIRQRVAAGGIGGNSGHRQQKPSCVEPGRRTVVRGAVNVDQERVDPRHLDTQGRLRALSDRYRQGESGSLPATEFGCHSDEFTHGLVLFTGAVEAGSQFRRRGHRCAVLQTRHHIADWPIADIGHGCVHRHGGVAGGGHHIRSDAVETQLEEFRAGLTRCGRGHGRQHQHGQQTKNDNNDPGCDRDPQQHGHAPEPRPFVRRSPAAPSGERCLRARVAEWVWGRS